MINTPVTLLSKKTTGFLEVGGGVENSVSHQKTQLFSFVYSFLFIFIFWNGEVEVEMVFFSFLQIN